MAVSPGERLGPYEILASIGKGGMGEVWQARDVRLNRDVAIKTSKEEFSDRFQHEAETIAALNHPNICQLYDVGQNYLVMELVDGVALKGPLPVAQAVAYAGQILDALDAAHRRGITHRDLKPANILVTKQGIKLLDFGLAKLASPLKEADSTLTEALTSEGQIVGTLQYMSPEQLKGQKADTRSDLFAFGCVLYEMLCGQPAFPGDAAAVTIGAILHSQPQPLQSTRPLEQVLSRCLAKDPEERFQTARDLKTAIQWESERMTPAPAAARTNHWWWLAAGLLPSVIFAWLWTTKAPQVEPVVRFQVPTPVNVQLRSNRLELSPDGQYIAFLGANPNRRQQIFLRRIDSSESKPLRNTEGAFQMFWSGDSRSLAFSDGAALRRLDIDGGNLRTIVQADGLNPRGAWNRDGVILFRSNFSGALQQILVAGGAASPAVPLNAGHDEIEQGYPSFLPDGRHFVFQSTTAAGLKTIELAQLGSRERKKLTETANPVVTVTAPGVGTYVAYQREQSLMVQEIDLKNGALKGEPTAVVDNLGGAQEVVPFSFSETGILAYSSLNTVLRRMIWYDRLGKTLDEVATNGSEIGPALSPDGNRLAVVRDDGSGARDVWVADLARKTWMRLSFGGESAINPIWSPDGKRIAYTVGGSSGAAILEKDSSGAGEVRVIGKASPWPQSWSPDGQHILYVDYATQLLMEMPTEGGGKPIALTSRKSTYYPASYSPDGKHIAYTSTESGRPEVYVMAVPPAQGRLLISTNGGGMASWRADGNELFYISDDLQMTAVDIRRSPSLQAGAPHPLFQTKVTSLLDGRNHYVVSRDGQRFLISSPANSEGSAWINVVLNWPELVKKRR